MVNMMHLWFSKYPKLLDTFNPLVMQYRIVKEHLQSSNSNDLRLKLIRKRNSNARTYNLPPASEVAALIVGNFDMSTGEPDIIVENRSGLLQRIDELHPLYFPMKYPLLFLYGEDGYRADTWYRDGSITEDRKRRHLTLTQYFAYKLQDRFPDLFITFTCNPRWPELDKIFKELDCKLEDRPDLVSRLFKIKFNKLIRDITKDMLFDNCRPDIYTIEFQKRGLPHAHILLWLSPEDKCTSASQIDLVIFAEIPNREAHPKLYEAVKNFMIHGPCASLRKSSPCMLNDDDNIDDVAANATMKQSKFIAWFEANKRYPFARDLTYGQFPTKFVFKLDSREWYIRKAGYAIGRLYYVPLGLGELHYLCLLLTFVKGATSFEDIRTVNGVLHPTFKDACYAMGLLDDDEEYVDGITEASNWSSGVYLRKLFLTLLVQNTILSLNTYGKRHGKLLSIEHSKLLTSLTDEQRNIFDMIMAVVNANEGGVFFINGFRGSGKTFVWNTLTSGLRSRGDIVLTVTSSGIASQLIPDGRTEHSRFTIPLDCNENSTCNIIQGSDLANLLIHTKLIIWDETPIAHRQILFVIPRASRQDIVLSALNSSYLCDSCKVLTLTKNMRRGSENSEGGGHVIHNFAEWILKIGEEVTYLSSDNICVQGKDSQLGDVYTTEFLNTISSSGLPYHQLKLKVSAPIMLLRNIDKSMSLSNGTRLTFKRLCTHVIEASILSGKHADERVIIARMIITPSDSRLPFKFQCRQFPVVLSFAMTINKSQGQTLSNQLHLFHLVKLLKILFLSSDNYKASTLIAQLSSMKYTGTKVVREHIMQMQDIVAQLKSRDIEITDSFLVLLILNSLPSRFGRFKITYNTHNENWSINELLFMCIQEKGMLNSEKCEGSNEAHIVTNTNKQGHKAKNKKNELAPRSERNKDAIKCFFCKKK
ncbi:ATP-dependent DNA helicase PIF1-like [Senna tora]|uniref:ATP-dependent DNA helicase n=1 Tax=Senna tora TaxID=362788 RepID=A0A834WTA7_9FABA|nr:ATP-dependent DNA helicase PIF1-like [Senna tora]